MRKKLKEIDKNEKFVSYNMRRKKKLNMNSFCNNC